MTAARIRRDRRGGFLMVEALAVLAISAAILLALGSLTRLMLHQADAVAERTTRLERAEQGLSALSRDIGRMARARWDGPERERFVFAGEPWRMLFALDRPAADGSALGETVAVLLRSDRNGAGGRLIRAEAPLVPGLTGADALAFGPERVLYEGPARIRFAYVAPRTDTTPELIVDAWPPVGPPPVAVRVGLADPAGGDVASALRVPVRAEGEPGCVRARTHYCSRTEEGGADDDAALGAILNAVTQDRAASQRRNGP
ncbi:hypothetical protein ASG52_18630 [Methylobacterium sp. Leaf456]|uniref:PulJ/GspJ family protein n=1 Tax=Methylobacterium sp. Leaf456 TaxID=1736382 RepID=UPI0007016CB6|nr:hypothetical protein [Methylobacterium sp. Leaf456]KQT60135.1 hypothetical protein ASG52_18630 [Methylobacterium sp. Leaf456]